MNFQLYGLIAVLLVLGLILVIARIWKSRPEVKNEINFDDNKVIKMGDDTDATSLLMTLTMNHGSTFMNWSDERDLWVLTVNDDIFTGKTQMEALLKAHYTLGVS